MSKLAQYEDYCYAWRGEPGMKRTLDTFVPDCDDCGVPLPEWDKDPAMHVQCDNCNSNNER
jgi:hypothetical protein